MDLLRAAILGIVQGLTEFLPVSSSGHLILVPALFNWPDQGLAFDVGLHLGTLCALLVYFWRDWYQMFTVGTVDFVRYRFGFRKHRFDSQMLWLIALGSIPAALVGALFNGWIEAHVRQPWLVAISLAVVGTILFVADRYGRRERPLTSLGLVDAVLIGLAQACALLPGVSRSGATMSTALFRGFTRDASARYAFLLGTPAFIGAAVLKSKDLAAESNAQLGDLAVGFAFSAIVGFLAISFLMRYVRTKSLLPFVIYRYGVAVLTLVIGAIRIA
ncbi:hypothetical protein AYO38_00530 [bacterium SCGC AG-212-C10]|nr:hypothetical protein AYO38_00530 [bacterium SCGC AG-212-C10]